MTLTIRRAGAAEYGRFIKMLVAGAPGAGKTRMGSTAPNPIYASAEGGLMSVADRSVPYVNIETSEDLLQLKVGLEQDKSVRAEVFGFDIETVVIDTIDEIQRILIKERLEETRQAHMAIQDWGWLGEQMQAIIRGFRNLDMHVIFNVHLKESSNAETGRTWFDPGLQGGIASQIPAYVDLACLLKSSLVSEVKGDKVVERQVRQLVTQPSRDFGWLKDRSGRLPGELEVNLTDDFDRIYDLIFPDDGEQVAEPLDENTQVEPDGQTSIVVPDPKKKAAKKASKKAAAKPKPEKEPEKEVEPTPEPEPEQAEEETAESSGDEPPEGYMHTDDCPKGNEFCEISRDQADLSRIRFRKILCRECHQSMKK